MKVCIKCHFVGWGNGSVRKLPSAQARRSEFRPPEAEKKPWVLAHSWNPRSRGHVYGHCVISIVEWPASLSKLKSAKFSERL